MRRLFSQLKKQLVSFIKSLKGHFKKSYIWLAIFCVGLFGGVFFVQRRSLPKDTRLVVVIVIDQLAYHYFNKLTPYLSGGIKRVCEQGVSFTQAIYPHAVPSTATGHAGLASGAYAKHHGIVNNSWVDEQGTVVHSTTDMSPTAGIFASDGITTYPGEGVSGHYLHVDNLSDSFVLSESSALYPSKVLSFSFKPRAAVMMAGRMGKAFWFDERSGCMTSSKAYFESLPRWLLDFNKRYAQPANTKVVWKPKFGDLKHPAYAFKHIQNYSHSALGQICNTTIEIGGTKPYEFYEKTPQSDQFVLDAAWSGLQAEFSKKSSHERCLLWISLSSLDLAGHYYGPHSLEAIDTVYHLDHMLDEFISRVQREYKHLNPLFVFTADHGVMPIPEVLNDEGYSLPTRVASKPLVQAMNTIASDEFGIQKLIIHDKAPMFYCNKKVLNELDVQKQHQLLNRLSLFLAQQKHIKNVWTQFDFTMPAAESECLAELFYNQYFPGRSPELICLLPPYHMLTEYPAGTSHDTPYLYDRHVPLCFWQPGKLEKKTIDTPINMLQVAPTIARLCNIKIPSACEHGPLEVV